jgi:hypothetical protein
LRLVLVNTCVAVALVMLFEVGTRLIGVHFPAIARPLSPGARGTWQYNASLGWSHRPGATGENYLGGPDRGRFAINALGFRGPAPEPEKPEGLTRVLVFGDSFVFGVGVDPEHLVTTHLGEHLNARRGERYEVLNMGVSGYSTDQELLLLRERGAALEPDLVVLVVCDNDFDGNAEDFAYRRYYKPHFVLDGAGGLQLRNVPVPELTRWQRAKLWLSQHSNAWNLVRSRSSDHPAIQRVLEQFQVAVPSRHRNPLRLTRILLQEFVREVDRLGASPLILSSARRGENPERFRIVARRLEQDGIPVLHIHERLAGLRRTQPDGLWDFPQDRHWNIDAHAVVARWIYERLAADGTLAPPQPPPAGP